MICQSCGGSALNHCLNLGYLPPPNDYRALAETPQAQTWMPTDLIHCDTCDLVQLGYVADASLVFPKTYPYTSGSTKILRDNFADLAREAREIIKIAPNDLVVDIGSNDGTLLSNFKTKVLGVEPTNVAQIAISDGIPTLQCYFDAGVAGAIIRELGKARVVTCANCFAHMDGIHDIIEAVKALLTDDGVFITESHYLMNLIHTNQYDTIYHEHLRYYSITSLKRLLAGHGLYVFHVTNIPTHGGSIRVYASRTPFDFTAFREPVGVELIAELSDFSQRVQRSKTHLLHQLNGAREQGLQICGIGAPSRAATVVNYCRLDNSLVDCTYEMNGSLKLSHYMPGSDIPVYSEDNLWLDKPDGLLLFSWHIADEIISKLRAKGFQGFFLRPCAANS